MMSANPDPTKYVDMGGGWSQKIKFIRIHVLILEFLKFENFEFW